MNPPAHLADVPSANEIDVRQLIEAGLADSKAGKTIDVTAVREKFGLPSRKRPIEGTRDDFHS